jgi:hypothetical protein
VMRNIVEWQQGGDSLSIVSYRVRRWELELELAPSCDICLKYLEIFPPQLKTPITGFHNIEKACAQFQVADVSASQIISGRYAAWQGHMHATACTCRLTTALR